MVVKASSLNKTVVQTDYNSHNPQRPQFKGSLIECLWIQMTVAVYAVLFLMLMHTRISENKPSPLRNKGEMKMHIQQQNSYPSAFILPAPLLCFWIFQNNTFLCRSRDKWKLSHPLLEPQRNGAETFIETSWFPGLSSGLRLPGVSLIHCAKK